jgi:hypothetical protein
MMICDDHDDSRAGIKDGGWRMADGGWRMADGGFGVFAVRARGV